MINFISKTELSAFGWSFATGRLEVPLGNASH